MRWKKIFLCLFSSGLLILSFPKFNLSFLAWFSLIPLLLAIRNLSLKNAFIFGFLSGFFAYLGLLYWIVTTITAAGEPLILGILCLLLLSAYLSLYFGLFCLGFVSSSHLPPPTSHLPPPTSYLLPAFLWVSLEYLRSHLFTGFPWALLGYSQWNFLPIIQISEFTGVYGASFLVALVNITIFQVLTIKNLKLKIKNLILTATIFFFSLVYGLFSLSTYLPRKEPEALLRGQPINLSTPFKVALLQGNIDQYKKWSKEYEEEIVNTYTQLACLAAKGKPDIIIWPESAIPGYLLYEPHLYQWVRNLIHQTGCYHLVGSVHLRENKLYNSVFLFSPQGRLLAEYDKIHLVPFGEVIPLSAGLRGGLSKYIKVLNELGDFSPGRDFTIFHYNPITQLPNNPITRKFSVNICFEAIFPHIVRKFVKNGAEIIVNLTNDAWFLKTSAPYQHFTINVFRAIENRKYVIRCANTGISGFIDPYGRIIKQTEIFQTCQMGGKVYQLDKKTFYSSYGDFFIFFCLGVTLVFSGNLWYTKKG